MITIQGKKIINILLIVYCFLFIFNPDFFPMQTSLLETFFAFIYVCYAFIFYKRGVISINTLKPILRFIPFIIYLVGSCIIRGLFDFQNMGAYISSTLEFMITFIRFSILYLASYFLFEKRNITYSKYQIYLVYIAIIQMICVILALLFPSIKNAFNNLTITNSGNDHLILFIKVSNYRCYGLAHDLFDSFGYITSMLIIIPLIYAIEMDKKWFFLFVPFLIMPLLNARTGLVLILTCFAALLVYYSKKILVKDFLKYLALIPIGGLGVILLLSIIPASTLKWIEIGMKSIITYVIYGERISTFSSMSKMIGLPSDIIWGMGASPELLSKGATDVGYVQCIWRYGLLGSALLFGGFVSNFVYYFRNANEKKVKAYIMCLTIIFFEYMYKLYSINNHSANFIIFSTFAVIQVTSQCRETNLKNIMGDEHG